MQASVEIKDALRRIRQVVNNRQLVSDGKEFYGELVIKINRGEVSLCEIKETIK